MKRNIDYSKMPTHELVRMNLLNLDRHQMRLVLQEVTSRKRHLARENESLDVLLRDVNVHLTRI